MRKLKANKYIKGKIYAVNYAGCWTLQDGEMYNDNWIFDSNMVGSLAAETNVKHAVKCWSTHDELLKALKLAATTIRTWHGESSWNLFEKSPEMQFINDAIKKAEL